MKGLSARWIGYHALAFGIKGLLDAVFWGFLPEFSRGNAALFVLNHAALAVLVAAAQGLSLAPSEFRVRARLWMPVTAAALALGSWVSAGMMEGVFVRLLRLLGSGQGMTYVAAYATVGIVAMTQGAVLGGAQGAVLLLRRERSPGMLMLWPVTVMGAWVAGQGVDAVIEASHSSILAMDKVGMTLRRTLVLLAGQLAFGSVVAAVTLPALRRLLAPRPLPS